jgi:predicted nucleic acid-binding protein
MVTNQSSVAELVADTSPLIVLGKVGRLDLLLEGSKRLVLPLAVADEIRAGPASDPGRIALDAGRRGDPVPVDVLPSVLEWGLGAGESAVLTLAASRGAIAVLDDREARRAAHALGIPAVGSA